ncbi:hypothetical protein [Pseudobutyrivibrio sp.]
MKKKKVETLFPTPLRKKSAWKHCFRHRYKEKGLGNTVSGNKMHKKDKEK